MIDRELQALLDAVGGTIVQDHSELPEAALKLEQGTLDDIQGRHGVSALVKPALSGSSDSQNSDIYVPSDDKDALFRTVQPSGAHHMICVKDLNGEIEASMVYQDKPRRPPKKGSRQSKGGVISAENQCRSIRRSKSLVREAAIMMSADHLITLTTQRAITDRDEFDVLLVEFLSRIRRLIKESKHEFQYILVAELHDSKKTSEAKRGSFHAHIATSGFVPYKMLWKAWRGAYAFIYGENEFENAQIQGQKGAHRRPKEKRKSVIAGYMSKYLGKSLTDDYRFNKKKFWRSNNIAKPVKTVYYLGTGSGMQYRFIRFVEALSGQSIVRQFDSRDNTSGTSPPFLWVSTVT